MHLKFLFRSSLTQNKVPQSPFNIECMLVMQNIPGSLTSCCDKGLPQYLFCGLKQRLSNMPPEVRALQFPCAPASMAIGWENCRSWTSGGTRLRTAGLKDPLQCRKERGRSSFSSSIVSVLFDLGRRPSLLLPTKTWEQPGWIGQEVLSI